MLAAGSELAALSPPVFPRWSPGPSHARRMSCTVYQQAQQVARTSAKAARASQRQSGRGSSRLGPWGWELRRAGIRALRRLVACTVQALVSHTVLNGGDERATSLRIVGRAVADVIAQQDQVRQGALE